MNEAELGQVVGDCPILFHMAERGSWPQIERPGLLSTGDLLALWEVEPERRRRLMDERRPEGEWLSHPVLGRALVRDQKPMDDAGLRRCLRDGLTPADWYRLLNQRVFFWLTRERLLRLSRARPYRATDYDVLELDTASLVSACRDRITLSPINSGATKPFGTPRGRDTFLPIAQFPYVEWRKRRPAREAVVELCVTGHVPDVARHVRRVLVMRNGEVLERLR